MGLAGSIAVIIALGSVLVWVLLRVRQSSIVAYLALGILSGPHALGLLATGEAAQALADIGLVMLLFFVGLEFDVKAILKFVRFAAPATIAHVGLITAVIGGIGTLLGFTMLQTVLIGLATALSSTAIVMKSFEDRKETDSATAQASLAVLLGQDFVALLVVALIPFLGSGGAAASGHGGPSGPIGIVIMAIGVPLLFFVARKVLPPLFKYVALSRNEEMLTLTSLAVCLVVASVTERLGAGLQLGAFLGGLVFSGTYYQHQIRADLTAIKNLALGFCFVSVGMLVDLGWAVDHAGLLAAAVVIVVAVKLLIGTVAFRLLRLPWSLAAATALSLSQVAEFAFIVAQAGQRAGVLTGDQFQLVVAVAVLSMLAAPAMVARSGPFGHWVAARFERGRGPGRKTILPPSAHPSARAVVVGYGPVGRTLCKILIRFGVQTCVIDLDVKTVQRLSTMGREAVYGDATRREVLEAAGLHEARYLIVTTPDFASRARIITSARALNPEITPISRARYLEERLGLEEAGAAQVAYEEAEVAAELSRLLLAELDVRAELLDAEVAKLRSEIAVRTGFTMIAKRPTDAPAGKTTIYIRDSAAGKGGGPTPGP
jgi:monovalent cation:H+ antiporter-2, CPA2 family